METLFHFVLLLSHIHIAFTLFHLFNLEFSILRQNYTVNVRINEEIIYYKIYS